MERWLRFLTKGEGSRGELEVGESSDEDMVGVSCVDVSA